jgi:hypothetical protein
MGGYLGDGMRVINIKNDIIPLLGDKWLNENEPNMKRILKVKILNSFS